MNFFQNIKEKLEKTLDDLKTIEHAVIQIEDGDEKVLIYKYQEPGGDCLTYQIDEKLDECYFTLLNESFSSALKARTGLIRIIIETLK